MKIRGLGEYIDADFLAQQRYEAVPSCFYRDPVNQELARDGGGVSLPMEPKSLWFRPWRERQERMLEWRRAHR